MSSKYQTPLNTINSFKNSSKICPQIQSKNNSTFKPSSLYYSQSKTHNEEQSKNSYITRSYLQRNNNNKQNLEKESPRNTFNLSQYKRMTEKKEKNKRTIQDKSFEPTERKINHSFYFSDFNKDKKRDNQMNNKYEYRSTYIPNNNNNLNKLNQKYQIHEIKNINNNKNNVNNNNQNRYNNTINYKERRTNTHITNKRYKNDYRSNELSTKKEYTNKSYQGIMSRSCKDAS